MAHYYACKFGVNRLRIDGDIREKPLCQRGGCNVSVGRYTKMSMERILHYSEWKYDVNNATVNNCQCKRDRLTVFLDSMSVSLKLSSSISCAWPVLSKIAHLLPFTVRRHCFSGQCRHRVLDRGDGRVRGQRLRRRN